MCPAPISILRKARVFSSFVNVAKHAKEAANLSEKAKRYSLIEMYDAC